MIKLAKSIRKEFGIANLCLGGVALNCVANGKILREKIFDKFDTACRDIRVFGTALALWYIDKIKEL